jgi:hypothetical protein
MHALQIAYAYNNTVYTANTGISVATAAVDDFVTENLVFAATPFAGASHAANNITAALADAAAYVNAPSFTPGIMDFYPRPGAATGVALDLSKFVSDPDYTLDFNGNLKAGNLFRGAYSGEAQTPAGPCKPASSSLRAASPPSPALASLSCPSTTLASGSTVHCSVRLTAPATADTAVLLIAASPISSPAAVSVSAGTESASFPVTAANVTSLQTASLTASLNAFTRSVTLNVAPAPLASLTCAPSTLAPGASATCAVALGFVAATATTVAISSDSAAIQFPASVTVQPGVSMASFAATAGKFTATQTVTLTARLNGSSLSCNLLLQMPVIVPAFSFRGVNSEFARLSNGAALFPTVAPAGLSGNVVVRGSGSVSFAPVSNGDGVTFRQGGGQNTSTGFLAFAGAPVSSLFNVLQGDITFYLKSNYSYAERMALNSVYRYVFYVDDGSRTVAYFAIGGAVPYVSFRFMIGGGSIVYYLPHGHEDVLYGKGVMAKIRLAWDGAHAAMFFNDTPAASVAYTPVAPAWTSAASFTIGANSLNLYGGGYMACDDAVADFSIAPATVTAGSPKVSLSPRSLTFASQATGARSDSQTSPSPIPKGPR